MAEKEGSDEAPFFARTSNTAELRQETPVRVLQVLDAIAVARDKTRTAIVNEILGEWAEKVLHESMLVHRVANVTPTASESSGARP